ncbi:hypothetical protein ADUPG1_002081, partial [Aduncisulcus paluster]
KKPQYILGFKTSLEKGLIDHLISEYVDFPQSMTSYEVDLEEKELMEKTKPPPNNVTFVEGFMVNEEFKEELKLVLQDYKRKNKKEYGKHTIPLEITLKPDTTLKCPPLRRIPRCHRDFVYEEVNKLLKSGVIRESKSWYYSPMVITPKKGNKKRMCIDFRKLNEVTVPYQHPLPRMDDTLDFLAGSRIFCTLDLSQGFHQVPLEPSSQPLTAFCTDRGIYEYTKMPFGLINAPAHFQWTMNRILAGLIGTRCVVYIDD